MGIGVASHGQQSLDAGGNWTSSGATETYLGWQGSARNVTSLGAAASFRKVFPSTPSSITFVLVTSQNLAGTLVTLAVTPTGTGAGFTAASFNFTQFYARHRVLNQESPMPIMSMMTSSAPGHLVQVCAGCGAEHTISFDHGAPRSAA